MAALHENLTRDEAGRRAGVLSKVTYDIALDLTGGDDVFGSETRIAFAAEPSSTTFLDCTAESVDEVTCNGVALDLDEVVQPTRILLPELAATNEVVVRARMRYMHEGRGLHHFRDPADDGVYLHSQFEPFDAHLVFACFDQPDLKATVAISVDAPADWVVVSNMAATRSPRDGLAGTWHFAATPLLSTYLVAIVAGNYAHVADRHESPHGTTDLGLYIRRSLLDHLDAEELFELTRQGLDWFNANFGIPYPFGKYDQLFVPEFSAGAMENPGCVTFTEAYVFRGEATDAQRERRAETVLHEMAHMWFGDLVTMKWWDDLWLNESFATFSAMLSQVEATRFDHGWITFLDSMKAWAKYQDQLPSTHPIAADMPDIESVHQNFDGITYAKGASVLRQLVAWVGQEQFLAGVRTYFDRHRWDNATLADFLRALEDASGRDLAAWRDAWLTTTGINTMAAAFEVGEDGNYSSFAVHQSADPAHPTLRPHRMAIAIHDWEDDRLLPRTRLELDVTGAETTVDELVGVPAGALVVLNADDLTYAKVDLDVSSLAVVTESLSSVADPMARALLWAAAWDMVRDAQMPASRYVELACANITWEQDVGVVARTLQRAEAAALKYADPERASALMARIAAVSDEQMRATADPNLRLAWARQFARSASTDDQLDSLMALLDGHEAVAGLEVDQDLRWRMVIGAAAAGRIDEAVIARHLGDDPSDFGERQATTARAARPDRGAKQAAWNRLVDDDSLSQTLARHLWTGFRQSSQGALIEPWIDPYFAALLTVWEDRSTEWAIEFASDMFPHPAASAKLAAKTQSALDSGDLPGPLARVLAEELDTLQRALRARALDAGV